MNEDSLIRTFDILYSSAQSAHKAGQYNKAKRDYYRAAQTMTELAKISSQKLKAARVNRAKRIIAIADSLPESAPLAAPPAPARTQNADARGDGEQADFATAEIPDTTFDDVVGLAAAKDAIRIKMIYPLEHGDVYAALGKKAGGGVLLYGPPGTGKTLLARAAAHEAKAAFFAVKCSDIVSKWVGESEKNIALLFDSARKHDRAIIFFDELDSMFGKRGADVHNDSRVNELLQQIDGFASNGSGLMVLGATNNPWAVDDAALRPGRFSQKVYIPLPDVEARLVMLKKRLDKITKDGVIDMLSVAKRTEGFSGADMTELIDRATDAPLMRSIVTGGVSGLTMSDMEQALARVTPSVDAATVKRFEDYGDI